MNTNDSTTVSCCVCCKEILLDAVFIPESAEYVEHFCGLECYQRFAARAEEQVESGNVPRTNSGICDDHTS